MILSWGDEKGKEEEERGKFSVHGGEQGFSIFFPGNTFSSQQARQKL
jgi:hypothetical protein